MMLIVLDKDPIEAARKVPASIRHKQLLELMQMLSCVVGFGYEKIPQGKKIKAWISNYKLWVLDYVVTLYELFCETAKNPKEETIIKYHCLIDLFYYQCTGGKYVEPTTAILRYVKEYDGTSYPTDTELPIEECIREYEKYVEWKRWE